MRLNDVLEQYILVFLAVFKNNVSTKPKYTSQILLLDKGQQTVQESSPISSNGKRRSGNQLTLSLMCALSTCPKKKRP